jgi:DNA (cytosine-5)-methyltransferase 1
MRAVDFFCGAGGLTQGLLQAGISVRLGLDVDARCRETYEANNPGARFLCCDLRTLQPDDLRSSLGARPTDGVLFAACAPCQPYSKQRGARRDSAARTLLLEFARFVEALRPGWVLVENVPGLRKTPGFSTYRRFLHVLDRAGYWWDDAVLDAKDYGVPQTRHRLVLVASRLRQPELPPPTHGPGRRAYTTVRDAIAQFPPISVGEAHPGVPNHVAADLSAANVARITSTPRDGGDRRLWPAHLRLPCHEGNHTGHTDVYGRMWWDRPAPALTCRCDSLSNGRYGHPEQHRAISLREAASLQSFPDDYVFLDPSRNHVAAQIGNAVPVALARVLGQSILRAARLRS